MKEKNKYFIVSDVHGEYDALIEALREAGYESKNPKHKLISCGDSFDRGPDSRKIYQFLGDTNAIAIKGNHDVMFEEFLDKGMDGEFVLFNILHNGLGATIASFGSMRERDFTPTLLDSVSSRLRNSRLHRWVKNMPLYFETENFIFCHAGVDPRVANWKNTDENFMLWDIEYSHRDVPNTNKIVVIGHHHAFRVRENAENSDKRGDGWCNSGTNTYSCMFNGKPIMVHTYGNTDENAPFFYYNKIAIDGCSNLTKKVNVLVIEDYPKQEEAETTTETQKTTTIHANYSSPWDGVSINLNNGTFYYTTTDMDTPIHTHTHGIDIPF